MKAAYESICARCRERIAKGAEIARHRNGYQHLACASGQDEE
jgi:hypothetical protein